MALKLCIRLLDKLFFSILLDYANIEKLKTTLMKESVIFRMKQASSN